MDRGRLKCWLLPELVLLLPWFLETSGQDRAEISVLAVSGSNASLQSSDVPVSYRKLTWFSTASQKIVEWEPTWPTPHYFISKFQDRVKLDRQDGTLHIYKLQRGDSSTYRLRVLTTAGTEKGWAVHLQVWDPVPKPVVTVKQIRKVGDGCDLVLCCTSQDASWRVTWHRDSDPLPEALQRSELEIVVKPQNRSSRYTCRVSNPVSNNSAAVDLAEACKLGNSSGAAQMATGLLALVLIVLHLLLP